MQAEAHPTAICSGASMEVSKGAAYERIQRQRNENAASEPLHSPSDQAQTVLHHPLQRSLSNEDLGYDPKMFGQKQIDSIVQRIKKEAASPQGFTEGQNRERRASKPIEENGMSVERMCHELKYLRQEVEFLKKIVKHANTKEKRPS